MMQSCIEAVSRLEKPVAGPADGGHSRLRSLSVVSFVASCGSCEQLRTFLSYIRATSGIDIALATCGRAITCVYVSEGIEGCRG